MRNILVVLLSLSIVGCASKNRIATSSPVGGTYYTKANIWYEKAAKPIAVNYHLGAMIPVGTKVRINACKGKRIQFATESGVTLTFLNAPKYSTIPLQELFNRYFSSESVLTTDGPFSGFDEKEKENIKKGAIVEGMSKEAVLMAYGYPPSHRTPSLTSDVWTYWESRFVNISIQFSNNRVSTIEMPFRR